MIYLFTFFNESWLLWSLYNKFFSSYSISIMTIGLLFSASQCTKICFDLLFGFFLNSINRKYIFILAVLCRILCLILWITYPCKTTFFIGMALLGIHISAFFEHFEGYLYDIGNNAKNYTKVLGNYYAVMNLGIFVTSFFLTFNENININFALKLQLAITLISLLIITKLPKGVIHSKQQNIIKRAKSIFTSSSIPIIFILTINEGLFMSSANMLSIFMESYSSYPNITSAILMCITLIKVPINFLAGKIHVKNPIFWMQIILLFIAGMISYGKTYAIAGIIAYFVLYAIIIIHLYKIYNKVISSENRMLAASMISIQISLFIIIFDLIIGYYGAVNGLLINLAVSFGITLYLKFREYLKTRLHH